MKVRAILNPRAGIAAKRARRAILDGPWPEIDLIETRASGHARELAQEAAGAGCELVLAAGGDGTANEVACGLLGSEVTLGLLPVGSGNGLARTLRIPLRPAAAMAALAGGVTRRMDVGFLDERPFLNVAGAGLDALIGADFHTHGRDGGRRGIFSYVRLTLKHVLSYQAENWRLEAGPERFEGRALIVAFANGRQYGGGAILAPRARLDDGRLDVIVIEDVPRAQAILNGAHLFFGTIQRLGSYRHLSAPAARLLGPPAFLRHRDGEPDAAAAQADVRLEPKALRILVPKATAEDPTGPFGRVEESGD